MKLSTKGRYASRLMLDLAIHDGEGPQSLKEIALRTGMTVKYLEQIISRLLKAGLVHSVRGQGGGYHLALPAAEIHLSSIIGALEGPLDPVPCVGDTARCSQSAVCVTREIWQELGQAIWNTLDAVRLEDMVRRHRQKHDDMESGINRI